MAVPVFSRHQLAGIVYVVFQISDTGIGIAQEELERLFEAFYQSDMSYRREYGGTGLGLAITQRFVEHLGGTISVASTEGEGSTFAVYLPRNVDAADEENARPTPEAHE